PLRLVCARSLSGSISSTFSRQKSVSWGVSVREDSHNHPVAFSGSACVSWTKRRRASALLPALAADIALCTRSTFPADDTRDPPRNPNRQASGQIQRAIVPRRERELLYFQVGTARKTPRMFGW